MPFSLVALITSNPEDPDFLRSYPFRVLRQRPIANFIVDFYCAALMLVIEVDGEGHFTVEGQEYDRERSTILVGLWVAGGEVY